MICETAEDAPRGVSAVPTGLDCHLTRYPALKCWAIFKRPSGTKRTQRPNVVWSDLVLTSGLFQLLKSFHGLPAEMRNSAQALSVSCADYAGLGNRERTNELAGRLLAHHDFSELDASPILPALTNSRRYDVTIGLLEGLQKRQPLSPGLMHHLGLAYEQTGKLVEARTTLERSVAGERPSVSLLLSLARIAHKQQDYQGALGYLAHARDLEPDNASLHYFFGLVCVDLNLVAEARNSFEKAVRLEPDNLSYNYAMGAASAFRHDPSEAIPYFEKYIRLKPQDPRGKLALGAALYRAKEFDAAARSLLEAVKSPETSTTAHSHKRRARGCTVETLRGSQETSRR